jgi:hypothetical protein
MNLETVLGIVAAAILLALAYFVCRHDIVG